MYKCPIDIITLPVASQFDGEILKVVHEIGINVDHDELVKALQYDRNQYDKGYADGIKDFAERVKESYGGFDLPFVINEILSEMKGSADNG